MQANIKSIKKFFGVIDETFKIPIYQRSYNWDENECKELIKDIYSSIERSEQNSEGYFIGPVFRIENKETNDITESDITEFLIIDGQQRLTTISLILLAIRGLIEDEGKKEKIKEVYLTNKYSDKEKNKMNLKSIKEDHEAFGNLLAISLDDKKLSDEDEDRLWKSRIGDNYLEIKKKLEKFDQEKLKSFYEAVCRVSILDVQLSEEDNPQLIFEGLNSKGKPLGLLDLIRNFILMGQEKEYQEKLYEDYWVSIEKDSAIYDVEKFIRLYLTLKQDKKEENKSVTGNRDVLYKKFKNFYEEKYDGEKTEYLLEELKRYSSYYKKMCENFKDDSEKIRDAFKILKIYTTRDPLESFTLRLLDKHYYEKEINAETVANIFGYIETSFVRRTICGFSYYKEATLVTLNRVIESYQKENEGCDYYEVFRYIMNTKVDDDETPKLAENKEFKEEFLKIGLIPKHKGHRRDFLVPFFLRLENHNRTDKFEYKIDGDKTIEHIMPKNLNKWYEELKEKGLSKLEVEKAINKLDDTQSKFLNKIGNLTLVNGEDNKGMGNYSFKRKKEILRKSKYTNLNGYFEELEEWREEEMRERSDKLFEKSLEIWPYQKSTFNPKEPKQLVDEE